MIICIFRIDLFVSLLISTRQIKERVTSTQVINYNRGQRKSQRRMKRRKRDRRISRALLRLLTLLLPLIKIVNDVRLIFSPIMNKCMYFFRNFAGSIICPRMTSGVLRNFYDIFDHAFYQIEDRENFIVRLVETKLA